MRRTSVLGSEYVLARDHKVKREVSFEHSPMGWGPGEEERLHVELKEFCTELGGSDMHEVARRGESTLDTTSSELPARLFIPGRSITRSVVAFMMHGATLFYLFVAPMRVFFTLPAGHTRSNAHHAFLVGRDGWFILDLLLDLVFVAMVLVELNTAKRIFKPVRLETRRDRILIIYLKNWRSYGNLLACIPVTAFPVTPLYSWRYILKLWRVVNIDKTWKKLHQMYRTETLQVLANLAWFSGVLAICWHYIGCFYFAVSFVDWQPGQSPSNFCTLGPSDPAYPPTYCEQALDEINKTWARYGIPARMDPFSDRGGSNTSTTAAALNVSDSDSPVSYHPDETYTLCFRACAEAWSPTVAVLAQPVAVQYLQALFWSIMVTVGVGRDIIPRTALQTFFSILAITVGVILYAMIIGSLTARIQEGGWETKLFRRKIQNVSRYMAKHDVPAFLRDSILAYYDYALVTSEKNGESDLQDLPADLLVRLRVSISKDKLVNVPAFIGCPSTCIISLIQVLQPKIGLPNEQLLFAGDVGDCFYIIEHGRAFSSIPKAGRRRASQHTRRGSGTVPFPARRGSRRRPSAPRISSGGLARLLSPHRKSGAAVAATVGEGMEDISHRLLMAVERLMAHEEQNTPLSGSGTGSSATESSVGNSSPWRDILTKVRQLRRRDSVTITAQLSDGDTFGHSALIRGRHQNNVHALTYVNLLMLHADKLDILAREFEPLRHNIKKLAKATMLQTAAVDKGTRRRLSAFQRKTARRSTVQRTASSGRREGREGAQSLDPSRAGAVAGPSSAPLAPQSVTSVPTFHGHKQPSMLASRTRLGGIPEGGARGSSGAAITHAHGDLPSTVTEGEADEAEGVRINSLTDMSQLTREGKLPVAADDTMPSSAAQHTIGTIGGPMPATKRTVKWRTQVGPPPVGDVGGATSRTASENFYLGGSGAVGTLEASATEASAEQKKAGEPQAWSTTSCAEVGDSKCSSKSIIKVSSMASTGSSTTSGSLGTIDRLTSLGSSASRDARGRDSFTAPGSSFIGSSFTTDSCFRFGPHSGSFAGSTDRSFTGSFNTDVITQDFTSKAGTAQQTEGTGAAEMAAGGDGAVVADGPLPRPLSAPRKPSRLRVRTHPFTHDRRASSRGHCASREPYFPGIEEDPVPGERNDSEEDEEAAQLGRYSPERKTAGSRLSRLGAMAEVGNVIKRSRSVRASRVLGKAGSSIRKTMSARNVQQLVDMLAELDVEEAECEGHSQGEPEGLGMESDVASDALVGGARSAEAMDGPRAQHIASGRNKELGVTSGPEQHATPTDTE